MSIRPHLVIIGTFVLEWLLEATTQLSLTPAIVIAATCIVALHAKTSIWAASFVAVGIVSTLLEPNNSIAVMISFGVAYGAIVQIKNRMQRRDSVTIAAMLGATIALLYPAILWVLLAVEQKFTIDGGQHLTQIGDLYGVPNTIVEIIVGAVLAGIVQFVFQTTKHPYNV